jgi:hypothetical protein
LCEEKGKIGERNKAIFFIGMSLRAGLREAVSSLNPGLLREKYPRNDILGIGERNKANWHILIDRRNYKMDEMKYEKIAEANSRAEAEVIESFLEAEGIDVELVEESVSHTTYAVPFARVEIFVPKEKAKQALKLLTPFDDIQPDEDEKDK